MMARSTCTIAALGLAAASTGIVIPVLRPLVDQTGHGSIAAGVFTAAHVIGGILGTACSARALRFAGSARRLAAGALFASILVTLATAAASSLEARIALRLLDGGCHLLAITALVAAATTGDAAARARRAVVMGLAIVLGIAAGLGLGAKLDAIAHAIIGRVLGDLGDPAAARAADLFGRPEAALVAAAVLSGGALLVVLLGVADLPLGAAAHHALGRRPPAPGLLAFGERYIFGTLTVAMPYLASRSRVGMVLGVFMVASVIAMPVARRFATRWGARRLAVRSTLGFAVTLGVAGGFDVLGSIGAALAWAIACGGSAGALYACALVLVARSSELDERMRDMGTVYAAGSAGHALGALTAGLLIAALPGMLVVAVPGIAIIAAATIGVWISVPDAALDCPVIGGIAGGETPVPDQPVT